MSDLEYNRLRWRCRRGMLELDAWLGGFLEANFHGLDAQERVVLSRLLDREDPDLFAWLSGSAVPPAEFQPLVEKIKHCMVRPR